jgi:hypothetical protein
MNSAPLNILLTMFSHGVCSILHLPFSRVQFLLFVTKCKWLFVFRYLQRGPKVTSFIAQQVHAIFASDSRMWPAYPAWIWRIRHANVKAHLHFWHRLTHPLIGILRLTTSVASSRWVTWSADVICYIKWCACSSEFPSWAELNSSDIYRASNHERRHYRVEWRHGSCRGEPDFSSSWS